MNKSGEQASRDNGTRKASNSEKYCDLHAKSVQGLVKNGVNSISPVDEKGPQTYPRFIPMHVLKGSSIECATSPPPTVPDGIHGGSNKFIDPSASVARSEHDSDVARSTPCALPAFHLAAAPVPDDYQPFANLIMSTLLQNPAVHAAATFAASFWPHSPGGLSTCTEVGFPPGQMNSPPSLAAVAAATVAAATAWWAAHGLLPLCAPFHSAFPCHPPPTNVAPSDDNIHAPFAKLDTKESTLRNPSVQSQEVDPEHSEASKAQSSPSKTTSSSSYSKENEATKTGTGAKPDSYEKPAAETDQKGSNGAKDRKQVDRSSCGSNTPSSSDVEADASEKLEKGKDEVKEVEADANLSASESNTRSSRSSNNLSEPWKSVSEEGRLAFQALFSREVLPQSFSSPNDNTNKRNQTGNKDEENKKITETGHRVSLALDLNSTAEATDAEHRGEKGDCLRSSENREGEGFLAIGLGASKHKGRMGFKPYKRCAVEAKESRIICTNPLNQAEQKNPKRIRLESEAST